jgi:hypothetical protein
MIHKNLILHNIAEVQQIEGSSGVRLQRVPEKVREKLSPLGQQQMLSADANMEIRFILKSDSIDITLSTVNEEAEMFIFFGSFQHTQSYKIRKEPTTIVLEYPKRLKELDEKYYKNAIYSPKVVRLMFHNADEGLLLHSIDNGEYALPGINDLPQKTLLSYGTSITHGKHVTAPHLTYPFQTAHLLGTDLINLGSSGSAFCENEIADYIADRTDWDIATLALSVNMRYFKPDEYYKRVEYMVNRVSSSDLKRPVFCITIYPFFEDFGVVPDEVPPSGNVSGYRQVLRDIVSGCSNPNVYLIEGDEILLDYTQLSTDLIHPHDLSMIQMGYNLSNKIKNIVH